MQRKYLNDVKNMIKEIFPQSFFLVITFCVFMPCSLFLGNIDEFAVDFAKILPIILTIGAILLVFLIIVRLLVWLLCKQLSLAYSTLIFSIAVGFYVQGNFLNPDFGELNGTAIEWSKYHNNGIVSAVAWAVCILIPLVFYFIKKEFLLKMMKWVSYFLASIQIITLFVLILTTTKTVEDDFVLSKKGEFELSSKNNIVIFVVDTLDAKWFEDIMLNDDSSYVNLKDFTYFDNAVSGGAPTILGIPSILTGQIYDTSVSIEEYYKEAYGNAKLFNDLQKNHYDVKLYTSYQYLNGIERKNINNLEEGHEYIISSKQEFAKYLFKLTSFYAMPQFMKQKFWFYSDDFAGLVTVKDKNIQIYELDDPQFYQDFLNTGISYKDDRNVFVMYHLMGSHSPYIMNENCERVDASETSLTEQTRGVFEIIFDYIDKMKKLGIYEKSTIIITADHGGVQLYQNPALLIKRKNESKDFSRNSNPVTFTNLYASIADEFLDNDSSYGINLFEIQGDQQDIRYHTVSHSLGHAYFPGNKIVEANNYTKLIIPKNARDMNKITVYDKDSENIVDYKMGETLYCTTEQKWFRQIKTGLLKGASEEGCRVLGDSLSVTFKLNNYQHGDMNFSFKYANVFNGNQPVEVYADGKLIGKGECKVKDIDQSLLFKIPKESVKDNTLVIELKFPKAVRPCDLNPDNADQRKLSVNLVSMELNEQ